MKRIAHKNHIFSSSSQEKIFEGTFPLNFQGQTTSIRPSVFDELHIFEKTLNPKHFMELKSGLGNPKKGLISYKSNDGLDMYAKEIDQTYIVISAGEIQPGLFKLFLEGAWEISN